MKKNSISIISIRIGIFIVSISILFSVTTCNKNDKHFFANSDIFTIKNLTTLKLEGTIMQFNDTIWHPVGIDVKDTLLFLKNRSTKYIYDVYNLKNNEKINEFSQLGQGPDEFIFPTIIQSIGASMWIYDRSKAMLNEYLVPDILSNHNPVAVKKIPLKNSASDKAAVLSDGRILASINSWPRGGFDFYDSKGSFLDSIGKFPELTSGKISDVLKFWTFKYNFTSNLTDRIFISYYYTDLVEIYDFNGNCIKRMHGPHQIKPAMDSRESGDLISARPIKGKTFKCYSFPVHAGNEVFVLYFGELSEDYQERDNKIIVFDWNGKPLRMYELDTHVFTFTVDYKNKIIYGISNSPEYRIIKFNY